MSRRLRLQKVLEKAEGREKKYDWLKALELYEQALGVVEETDFARKGEIEERVAHCFYKAAFQANSQAVFRKRMGLSVEVYDEATMLFEGLEDSERQASVSFCRGKTSYNRSWLAKDPSEKKAFLDECGKLLKQALKAYKEAGDKLGYGKACNELLICLSDRQRLAWDLEEVKNVEEGAVEYGEKAIEALSEVGDEYELTRTYYLLSDHCWIMSGFYESIEKQEEYSRKGLTYAQKALEISEKAEDSYLIGMSSLQIGYVIMEEKGDFEASLRHWEKALELGTKLNDKLIIGQASDWLAYTVWWKANMEEDPDKERKGLDKAVQYAEDAKANYQLVSHPPLTAIAHGEYCLRLANLETNLEKKRVLLEKTIEVGRRDLDNAERSGLPGLIYSVFHSLSKALFSLSILETRIGEKRRLLNEASKCREENIKRAERLTPFDYWSRGVNYNYSARIKAEQAKNIMGNQAKIGLVKKAVQDMEACLKLCKTAIRQRPQEILTNALGNYQYHFGGILNQLYLLTGEHRHLETAIMVYEEVIQAWKTWPDALAVVHWQIAKLHDHLGKHTEAADQFESASGRYTLAADKIPQLKLFYTDHATYMQAWNEIEKAKHHHAATQYGLSKVHYEKAADLHRKTERWNYLSHNYLALARIEEAEDFSRREQTEESKVIFQQAAKLFLEAKEAIETKLKKIETEDEKKMAAELGKASANRREYCLGRISLEEAKILDRQGNHAASSAKYASAVKKFQETIDAMEKESDRKELEPIVYLSKAWEMMTRAEAETSPDRYLEASKLFDEARKHGFDENARVLALGHSCFCKALEAGARFETTRDMTAYSAAKKHLEASANHYVKAGYKTAAEYARATNRLLDAYLYGHKGEMETDPTKKAQYYQMAEKLLQASANSYMKANHHEKGDEVRRLLESVKEERQLAMSLSEVLHAPTTTSTTSSFTPPNPTYETAVGLEIFEHAHIQANLIVQEGNYNVGEAVHLEIEMVNVGKGAATLVKVEDLIPTSEFKIVDKPQMYRVEDSYLNMKGKRLNPLKTEDVKIVVTPKSKGTFTMKPRILYVDETGQYKSHEPEPATITVKELGISGWIKGER